MNKKKILYLIVVVVTVVGFILGVNSVYASYRKMVYRGKKTYITTVKKVDVEFKTYSDATTSLCAKHNAYWSNRKIGEEHKTKSYYFCDSILLNKAQKTITCQNVRHWKVFWDDIDGWYASSDYKTMEGKDEIIEYGRKEYLQYYAEFER